MLMRLPAGLILALLIGCGDGGTIEREAGPPASVDALVPPLPLLMGSVEAPQVGVKERAGEHVSSVEAGTEVRTSVLSVSALTITPEQAFSIALGVSGDVEWALWATKVMRCESTFYIRAVGKLGEVGLLQLHPVHRDWVDLDRALVSPWYNITMGWELYQIQGKKAWKVCGA